MKKDYIVVGWREWLALPQLGIDRIKAKIDTGARTSALHAFEVESFELAGKTMLRFTIHPLQHNLNKVINCTAPVKDIRWITDSGGHKEQRYVIETLVMLENKIWPIEITLTNRDIMTFRMLLGRTALRKQFLINPSRSMLGPKQKIITL